LGTQVAEILKREYIRDDDTVSLLKLFGERTIVNPFRLRPILVLIKLPYSQVILSGRSQPDMGPVNQLPCFLTVPNCD
jgi:hypothetical protein